MLLATAVLPLARQCVAELTSHHRMQALGRPILRALLDSRQRLDRLLIRSERCLVVASARLGNRNGTIQRPQLGLRIVIRRTVTPRCHPQVAPPQVKCHRRLVVLLHQCGVRLMDHMNRFRIEQPQVAFRDDGSQPIQQRSDCLPMSSRSRRQPIFDERQLATICFDIKAQPQCVDVVWLKQQQLVQIGLGAHQAHHRLRAVAFIGQHRATLDATEIAIRNCQ